MSWYPDLDTHTMVASGDHVRAIGWLTGDKPYQQGEVPSAFLSRLDELVRLAGLSAEVLSFPVFGGFHECELCDRPADLRTFGPSGSGNLGVPDGPVLYVAPELVAHYVRVHRYRPPAEFVAAVLASPLPGTPEYRVLAEPFAHLHRAEWERVFQRQIDHAGRWARERGGTDEAVWEAVRTFCGSWTAEMFERVRTAMQEVVSHTGCNESLRKNPRVRLQPTTNRLTGEPRQPPRSPEKPLASKHFYAADSPFARTCERLRKGAKNSGNSAYRGRFCGTFRKMK